MNKVVAMFDFDGTLVNTPRLYYAAHREIFQALTRWRSLPTTYFPSYEDYLREAAALEGIDYKTWYRKHGIELVDELAKNESSGWMVRFNDRTETTVHIQITYPEDRKGGTRISEADFEKLFNAFFTRHHLTKVKMMPGARYLIEVLLKRGISLAIISGAPLARIVQILDHLELPRELFDSIESTTNKAQMMKLTLAVREPRPKPMFYLGDMPADIVSARQARVVSVAFMSDMNRCIRDLIDAQHPDYKINDWRDLSMGVSDDYE